MFFYNKLNFFWNCESCNCFWRSVLFFPQFLRSLVVYIHTVEVISIGYGKEIETQIVFYDEFYIFYVNNACLHERTISSAIMKLD